MKGSPPESASWVYLSTVRQDSGVVRLEFDEREESFLEEPYGN